MARSKFQAPRVLQSFEQVQEALRQVQESLDEATGSRAELRLNTRDFPLVAGNFHRASAQTTAGIKARLPAARGDNLSLPIVLHLENMLGAITIYAAPGQQVNGSDTATFDTDGVVVFWSNGVDSWSGIAQLPSESPAAPVLDADYVVGTADPDLPNARVATASVEITPDIATPNVISWALNTASVAFAKLANLTGLSVLGRAGTTAGVMAAITSTAARQVLRNNDAGTSLEWGHPVEIRNVSGIDQGDAFAIRFNSGNRNTANSAVAAGVATISYDWNGFSTQVDDIDVLTSTNTLDFVSSTSIIASSLGAVGTEANVSFQRAALTGFVSATQNSNATTSAEPIVTYSASANMSAERVLTGSTSVTISTAVAGQIAPERAALIGEVTAPANSNTTTVVRSTDFTWTGDHYFEGELALVTEQGIAGAGPHDVTLTDGVTRLTFTGASPVLNSVSGGTDIGRLVLIYHNGTGVMTVKHSTAGGSGNESRLFNPGNVDAFIGPRESLLAQANGTAGWRTVLFYPQGRLITVTGYITAGAGTHTFDARTRSYMILMMGGGGGGGGANSAAGQSAVGGQGATGAEAQAYVTTVPASVDYSVGSSGTAGANTGGNGGAGGNTTWGTAGTQVLVPGGNGGTGSATATFGSGSNTTAGRFSKGGEAAGTSLQNGGAFPTGWNTLWSKMGVDGQPGMTISGTAGWGGGGNNSGNQSSKVHAGALSLNGVDRLGVQGITGRIVVWEFS